MSDSASFSFPKSLRLRSKKDYQRMHRCPRQHVTPHLLLAIRYNGLGHSRLGLVTSKKFGRAHERNLFRRKAREAFRLIRWQLIAGVDIQIRPGVKGGEVEVASIQQELLKLLKRPAPPAVS